MSPLTKATMTTLYNTRLQIIAIFMYKIKHKLLPNNILHKLLPNSEFRRPRFNGVKYGKHSLRYFGPYLWDKRFQN